MTTIVVGDGKKHAPQLDDLGERALVKARKTVVRVPKRRRKTRSLLDDSCFVTRLSLL
jgi:hypothetical protein